MSRNRILLVLTIGAVAVAVMAAGRPPVTAVAGGPTPQPREACCLPDGSCIQIDPLRCHRVGGTPMGVGTTCADVTCPTPTVACCFPDGTCQELGLRDCFEAGGRPSFTRMFRSRRSCFNIASVTPSKETSWSCSRQY